MAKQQEIWLFGATAMPIPETIDPHLEGWNAGCDALTLSLNADGDDDYERWVGWACEAVAIRNGGEYERRNAMLRGYIGVRPHPDVFVGRMNGQGLLLSVTGALAGDCLRLFIDADNCSRMDVQVTVWSNIDPTETVQRAFVQTVAYRDSGERKGRPYRARLETTAGDGDTLYLGARSSVVFGRMYDKQRQSNDPAYVSAHRYEIELKDAAAWRAYWQLNGVQGMMHKYVTMVSACFSKWGIPLPQGLCVRAARVPAIIEQPFAVDRTMAWLRTQVAPSVEKLLANGVEMQTIFDILFSRAMGGVPGE